MSESRFENKLCPVCRKRFGKDDDIVVCPDCGTPHHRDCWNSEGHCALTEFHGMNYVWNGRLPDETERIEIRSASDEQPEIPSDPHHAEYPDVPQIPSEHILNSMIDDPMIAELVKKIQNNEPNVDGVSMKELAAYSATSIWHYARAFSAFRGDNGGKRRIVFFNFCSGIFAPVFQFYRKMDFFGIITMAALILPVILMVSITGGSSELYYLINGIIIAEEILLCLFSDFIYYKHAVRKIRKIRAAYEGNTQSDEYFLTLYECGKPSFARAALGLLAMLFAETCISVMI